MTTTEAKNPSHFLRQSLRGNALFSTLSGLLFLFASHAIAAFLGELPPLLVAAVGVQLLLFAGALVWLASRSEVSMPLVLGVISADLLWVAGTIIVVYADVLSRGGAIFVSVLANVVLAMAILQSVGVQRLTRSIRLTQS